MDKEKPDNVNVEESGQTAFSKMIRSKWTLPLILLLLCIVIYFVKDAQVKNARERAEVEKKEMIDYSNRIISEKNEYFLKLISTPFSWALRTSLLSSNVELVHQYLYEFIKNRNYELILVTDAGGKIISSTDKKLEGTDFSGHFQASLLTPDSAYIDRSIPGKLIVVSPIMGFNSKLGSMVSVYIPEPAMEVKAKD